MSFIQGETTHGLGEYSASQAMEHSFPGIGAKVNFIEH